MRRLLALLHAEVAAERGEGVRQLRMLLREIEGARRNPPDMKNPLAYRAAVKTLAELLVELYGNQALARARMIEQRFPRTLARVVTRRLEWMQREAERTK